jgi:hypothetical protein
MKIYRYVVRYDVGFAPNPYFGVCSLATCKRDIRKHAQIGDWIVGTGSAEHGHEGKLVFAMLVDEIISFDEYWDDTRFASKRPRMGLSRKLAHGDNIYHRGPAGEWQQEDSRHSFYNGQPNPGHVTSDTGVDRILLGRRFVYFGGDGPLVPRHLREDFDFDFVHVRRGYRVRLSDVQEAEAIVWLDSLGTGVLGRPREWPQHDTATARLAS